MITFLFLLFTIGFVATLGVLVVSGLSLLAFLIGSIFLFCLALLLIPLLSGFLLFSFIFSNTFGFILLAILASMLIYRFLLA